MTVTKTLTGDELVLAISGRIDTITSTQLSEDIDKAFEEDFKIMKLDFSKVDYISSAGLRIIIIAHKKAASKERKFELINVNQDLRNLFEMTGFSKIFTIA